jgi:3-oxoacyl-[acyl-carrier protein] reductase
LRAASNFIREAAKREAEAGISKHRKVVNISSTSGVYGNAGQANYAAAKAGINGLTKAMAKEWGRYKVNVNSVAFGLIMTRLTQPLTSGDASVDIAGRTIAVGVQPDRLKAAEATIPLGRGGTPEEAAGAVYMFCIPESNYVSGQVLVCGGGRP